VSFFIAADTCLPHPCLEMDVLIRSTVPTFSRHVTTLEPQIKKELKYYELVPIAAFLYGNETRGKEKENVNKLK
jgi:hypothetical protein